MCVEAMFLFKGLVIVWGKYKRTWDLNREYTLAIILICPKGKTHSFQPIGAIINTVRAKLDKRNNIGKIIGNRI